MIQMTTRPRNNSLAAPNLYVVVPECIQSTFWSLCRGNPSSDTPGEVLPLHDGGIASIAGSFETQHLWLHRALLSYGQACQNHSAEQLLSLDVTFLLPTEVAHFWHCSKGTRKKSASFTGPTGGQPRRRQRRCLGQGQKQGPTLFCLGVPPASLLGPSHSPGGWA